MSKTFVLSILLAWQLSYSQDYTPFYVNNAVWVMETITPVLGPGDGRAYWEILTLGDTTISEKTYSILATRNICELWPDDEGNPKANESLNTDPHIFGGIREEDKKVYFVKFEPKADWRLLQSRIHNFELGKEHLLYDFDIVPGDTIRFSDLSGFTISNQDTTHYTEDYYAIVRDLLNPIEGHARYEVTNSSAYAFPYETMPLVEGIGSGHGLFGSYDSYYTYLRCFTHNGQTLVYDIICDPCAEFVSTKDENELSPDLVIYPNPVKHNSFVTIKSSFKMKQLSLVGAHGQLILHKTVSCNSERIDIAEINPGVIFLHIGFDNGSQLSEKIVIVK